MTHKSLLGKIWTQKTVSEPHVMQMMQKHDFSELLARLLILRNISADQAQSFLTPKIRDFIPDPFHLRDMDKAVKRTIEAIYQRQKICIFGDYDVDGATSSALLKRFFADIDVEVDVYIPDRLLEGYGPSAEAMHTIKVSGASLVITVDCGAMAFEALNVAKELGLDVIVLDHHIGGEELPEAVAVVNPNRLDETTEYRYLAAVGVSFLFVVGVMKELKRHTEVVFGHAGLDPTSRETPGILAQDFDNYNFNNINLLKYLDLVALGTVCDVMPLIGLNRAFVSQGLKVMSQRGNRGLKTLADMARIGTAPGCYHLGFVIGPRINAGGRVGRADLGSRLLSGEIEEELEAIAMELEGLNEERRQIEIKVLEEAIAMVESPNSLSSHKEEHSVILVAGNGWHPGVIGIVASRLKERYQKPVAVVAVNEGIGKASCRSVKGIDFGSKIVEAKLRGLIEAGGGHAMAAGFTVLESKIEELREFLAEALAKEYRVFAENYTSEYEAIVTTSGLNMELVTEIQKLGPFGSGNHEPLIRIDNLFVLQARVVGDKHISCLLTPSRTGYGSRAFKAIAFNCMENRLGKALIASIPEKISVIGHAKINEWKGSESVQFVIEDIITS